MGFWQRVFGSTSTPEAGRPAPPSLEELVEKLKAGAKINLHAAFADVDDDVEEAGLWTLLPHASGPARVEIVERLCEFELDAGKQELVLRAAVERVPGMGWTAPALAQACDFAAITQRAARATPQDEVLLDMIGHVIAALCEAALGEGPADDDFDVAGVAPIVRDWCKAVQDAGGGPGDLVALELARLVCSAPDLGDDELAAGWGPDLAKQLEQALKDLLSRAPRVGGTWRERILADLASDRPEVAVQALAAARLAEVPVRQALIERVQAAPDDEGAWSLALMVRLDDDALDVLVPLALTALHERRDREEDLCSPASQAGCESCSTTKHAAGDDDKMVPKSLEARILPLLATLSGRPGRHIDLLDACLQAPSPNLRMVAASALLQWPPQALDDRLWASIEALDDDSNPQVHERVTALLDRGREPLPADPDDEEDADEDDEDEEHDGDDTAAVR
jgi:hypothetical protein